MAAKKMPPMPMKNMPMPAPKKGGKKAMPKGKKVTKAY